MYKKLRGRIVEMFGSQQEFAEHIGVTIQTVSRKLNGKVGFSQKDIVIWSEALGLELKDAGLYFLCDKSSKG